MLRALALALITTVLLAAPAGAKVPVVFAPVMCKVAAFVVLFSVPPVQVKFEVTVMSVPLAG